MFGMTLIGKHSVDFLCNICYAPIKLIGGRNMEKGTIVYLNGVTSTGKTSIVAALRRTKMLDFYYLSDDIFDNYIIDALYGAPDYWQKLSEAVFLMYRTACLFSDCGKTVVIDSMLLENESFSPHYSRMLQIFEGYPLHVVDVYCDPEICRLRNLARGNRGVHQSDEQLAVMAKNVNYALRLDTGVLTPEQCAARICSMLNA